MDTTTVTMKATDGSEVKITIPTEVPSNERADYLLALYNEYVHAVGVTGHWKDEALGICLPELAADVAEAMDFMGALVDLRSDPTPEVEAFLKAQGLTETRVNVGTARNVAVPKGYSWIYSRGYWAHGF